MELGFKISIVSEIPDFLSCIPDFTCKNFLDSGNSIGPYIGQSYTLLSHSQEKFPLPCDINRCDDIAVIIIIIIIIIKKVASTVFLKVKYQVISMGATNAL